MKKLFITVVAAITIGSCVFAGPASVSNKANAHFTANFNKANNVAWNSDYRFDKVNFILNNEQLETYYDANGDLIGTGKKIAFDKLPNTGIRTVTAKYTFPDYQVRECIEFTNAYEEKNYYVSLESLKESIVLEVTDMGVVSLYSKSKK